MTCVCGKDHDPISYEGQFIPIEQVAPIIVAGALGTNLPQRALDLLWSMECWARACYTAHPQQCCSCHIQTYPPGPIGGLYVFLPSEGTPDEHRKGVVMMICAGCRTKLESENELLNEIEKVMKELSPSSRMIRLSGEGNATKH